MLESRARSAYWALVPLRPRFLGGPPSTRRNRPLSLRRKLPTRGELSNYVELRADEAVKSDGAPPAQRACGAPISMAEMCEEKGYFDALPIAFCTLPTAFWTLPLIC